jgi:1-acyl-sn-glycerol-3-phosphate acyltransferase
MPALMSELTTRPGLAYRLLQKFLLGFFRTFYLFEAKGLESIPASGPVIIAANHVNPLDAVAIAACVPRRMRFVVWNRTFSKPVIGGLLRATGCIPINRERPDLAAFRECLRWLEQGNVLGIFPEGRYTETGRLQELKPGTGRIALAAAATVVPATLTGAYRAWPLQGPGSKLFPRPWKISLKFHTPIEATTGPQAAISDQKAHAQTLIQKIAAAINATLEPAMRAEEKIGRLAEQPASHVRIYEWFLCIVLLATWQPWAAVVAAAYFLYLLADIYLIRQSPLRRAARNFSPLIALVAAYPSLTEELGPLPIARVWTADELFRRVPKLAVWTAVDWWFFCYLFVIPYLLWALIGYCFRKYLQFQRLVRGLLLTLYACLLEMMVFPPMRHQYPMTIDPSQHGLYVRFVQWINPLEQSLLLLMPSLFVSLSAFMLAFDFAHDRKRFLALWFVIINTWVSAVVLRGYPLGCITVNFATVAAVFVYMNLFKFRAHDGRRI